MTTLPGQYPSHAPRWGTPRTMLGIVLALSVAACDANGTGPEFDGPAAIQLSLTQVTLGAGDTAQVQAVLVGPNGAPFASPSSGRPQPAIRWASSDESVASVSAAGLIVAKKDGATDIRVVSGNINASAKVTVAQPGVVRVNPKTATLTVGQAALLTATVEDRRGIQVNSPRMRWQTLDPTVATVDSLGSVLGVSPGTARVVAGFGSVFDTASITVVPAGPVVGSIAVSPKSPVLNPGGSVLLSATVRAQDGTPIALPVAWTSLDPVAATVDPTGQVTAGAVGTARVIASAGGKADTATVTVQAPLPVPPGEFVVFPNAAVEFIVGPQLRSGSSANPWPWFDQNAIAKGHQHGNAFPVEVPSREVRGRVRVTNGSAVVHGTGTRFTEDARQGAYFFIVDATGTQRLGYSASIQNDSVLTLSGNWQWQSGSGLTARSMLGSDFDPYSLQNYYDQALAQYINYYRTGDVAFLQHARKIADSWWESWPIARGTFTMWGNSYSPRTVSMGGLMLRALDGRPEMWPWITDYVRAQFDVWVRTRITYPQLYFGVRDGGYMLLYAAWLAEAHPDPAVRQEFRSKALQGARDYYARLQHQSGAWFWSENQVQREQPFMVGLLLEGMIAVHRQSGDAAVRDAILRSVEHQWAFYRLNEVVPERPDTRWRSVPYFIFPDGTWGGAGNLAGGWDTNTIREGRQQNVTLVHAFGYAYHITRDAKYRQWGDEFFASSYGAGTGPGSDAFRSLADFRAREYNQAYRSAGRYLAWRLAN
jgi:uncharacterized protein YjdB